MKVHYNCVHMANIVFIQLATADYYTNQFYSDLQSLNALSNIRSKDGLISRVLMICAYQLAPVISEQHWWLDLKLEQISHCKDIEINISLHLVALWKNAFKQYILYKILYTITSAIISQWLKLNVFVTHHVKKKLWNPYHFNCMQRKINCSCWKC